MHVFQLDRQIKRFPAYDQLLILTVQENFLGLSKNNFSRAELFNQ